MLIDFISIAFTILYMLIIFRVIMSWLPMGNPNNPIIRFIYETTEIILGPIRRLLPKGSMPLDFSPLIALLLLQILQSFIISFLR